MKAIGKKMKLYLLRPIRKFYDTAINNDTKDNPWNPWYDKYFGFIIRAENEYEARSLAPKNGNEVGKIEINHNPWLDRNYSECTELTNEGKSGKIICDFRSA